MTKSSKSKKSSNYQNIVGIQISTFVYFACFPRNQTGKHKVYSKYMIWLNDIPSLKRLSDTTQQEERKEKSWNGATIREKTAETKKGKKKENLKHEGRRNLNWATEQKK